MPGVGAIAQDEQRFTLPKREKVPSASDALGEYSQDAQRVTDEMLSGSAFTPYREASTEAMGRREKNKRALAAGQVSRLGQGGQGFGKQIVAGTEQALGSQRFDTMLQQNIAEQEMKERGVGMYQRGRAGEADIAFRQEGVRLQEEGLEEQRLGRVGRENIAREQIGSQERMSQAQLVAAGQRQESIEKMHGLDLGEKQLAREALDKFRQGQLDLSRDEFNALDKARDRGLDLSERELAALESYREKQLGMTQQGLDIQKLSQLANEAYQTGQLDLGFAQLDFNKMSFDQKQQLAEDSQKWLEQYQAGQLTLEELQTEIDKGYKEALIDLKGKELEQHKQILEDDKPPPKPGPAERPSNAPPGRWVLGGNNQWNWQPW